MDAATSSIQSFGGFSLGSMQLALPMEALREVMPCGALIDLPCPAACVVGGLDLRGVVVPVVDLRIALGREVQSSQYPCVIIMAHAGKLLGLLADGVTGIFACESSHIHLASSSDPTTATFLGSIRREDADLLVSLLSPQALSQLDGVPMVEDPEPDRQRTQEERDEVQISDEARPMMLMRCSRIALAMDAMAVHATMSHPDIYPSALAMGHCRGVIDYAGAKVPAVDLQSLCGLGELDVDEAAHAFVLSLDAGHVAFLVSEVIDVVRTMPDDVMPVPAFALPNPDLFSGALRASVLSTERAEHAGEMASQYLLLNGPALKAFPAVAALAGVNAPMSGAVISTTTFSTSAQSEAGTQAMLTYTLGGETATPLEQVEEILPYACDTALSDAYGPLLGFMVNRNRSIPVLSLTHLTGSQADGQTPPSSVLVVASEGELVGFAVPQLRAIEQARWTPGPEHGSQRASTKDLAQVGAGPQAKLLPVIDLRQMARSVQQRI